MARKTAVLFSTIVLSILAFAEGTRTWEQSKFDELSKGTAKGVALRSNGGLELAPAFKALATTPSTYIWSIASDSAGNIYAAAGSPARVYKITPDGQTTPIFEPQELQVQALVVDKNNVIYAATAPDGKVYRIQPIKPGAAVPAQTGVPAKGAAKVESGTATKISTSPYSATPYFEPGTKYIWDLVFDDSGNLYVATGDHGEIYKVTPNGQHSVLFKSDEVHIRVLALDPKGNLIAGSDGSGLVYRITPAGDAFVLFSAPKKEITALAIDKQGNIYAASAGEKRPGVIPPGAGGVGNVAPTPQIQPGSPTFGTIGTSGPGSLSSFPAPGMGASGGSEIDRIAPDGSPSHYWSSRDDLVYAMDFDSNGHLLAGTGNRGHIIAIKSAEDYSDLAKASASQITAFAKAPGGGLYASSSNLGKVFVLGPGPETEGTYESDVFDAKVFSRWGRANIRSSGGVDLYARSGNVDNPDRNWSPWAKVEPASGSELKVPTARFVQWKAILHAGTPEPRLDSVLLYYLPKNVAPEIDDISMQPNTRYTPTQRVIGSDRSDQSTNPGQPRFEPPPPSTKDRDSIGIRWSAHDDNDDQLVYSVYYRGDGESRWLLLKDDLTDKFYSFDSSLLPDGGYKVKIVASDAPSHSPGEELYAERESNRFEVDTTPPVIDGLTAAMEGNQIRVKFRATDSFSPIKRAEYSLDGGDWQFVEPVGQLSDSKSEAYDFRITIPPANPNPAPVAAGAGNDHVVVVRAYDRFDNLATAKTVIRAPK